MSRAKERRARYDLQYIERHPEEWLQRLPHHPLPNRIPRSHRQNPRKPTSGPNKPI